MQDRRKDRSWWDCQQYLDICRSQIFGFHIFIYLFSYMNICRSQTFGFLIWIFADHKHLVFLFEYLQITNIWFSYLQTTWRSTSVWQRQKWRRRHLLSSLKENESWGGLKRTCTKTKGWHRYVNIFIKVPMKTYSKTKGTCTKTKGWLTSKLYI